MVTEQTAAVRRLALASSADREIADPRLAEVLAAARSWDEVPGDRRDLPPPRGGWERCFATAALRGFRARPGLNLAE